MPRWVALLAVGSRGGVGPSRVKLTIRRVAVFASRAGQQACGGIGAGPDAQASRGNLTGSGGVWAFGYDAAQGAIVDQLRGLVGQQSAEILQSMIYSAGNRSSGTLATIIGIGTLLLTATGAFGEIQTSLNAIWKAEPSSNLSQLVRARLLSLGLVVTLGFLMLVSLLVSAALTGLKQRFGESRADLMAYGRTPWS